MANSGQFKPGRSGNPKGRPRGARNKISARVQDMLSAEAPALVRKAIDMALDGDAQALRLCLERICPPQKDRPVPFPLGATDTAADIATAGKDVIAAVAEGHLTPSEGEALFRLLEARRRIVETADLEARIADLEARS